MADDLERAGTGPEKESPRAEAARAGLSSKEESEAAERAEISSVNEPARVETAERAETSSVKGPEQVEAAEATSISSETEPMQVKAGEITETSPVKEQAQVEAAEITSISSETEPVQVKAAKRTETSPEKEPAQVEAAETTKEPVQVKAAEITETKTKKEPAQAEAAETTSIDTEKESVQVKAAEITEIIPENKSPLVKAVETTGTSPEKEPAQVKDAERTKTSPPNEAAQVKAAERPGTSPKNEPAQVEAAEDAETRAARRELKQSCISDQSVREKEETSTDRDKQENSGLGISEAQNDELKEQASLPKKKRAYDQLEENQESPENDDTSVTSTDSARNKTSREEPEKKRHRDQESTDAKQESTLLDVKETQHVINADDGKVPGAASSVLFANSAFGQLASECSGFASLASSQGKGFSSAKRKLSSFASTTSKLESEEKSTMTDNAPPAALPRFSFGSSPGASPFAGLSTKANGFGGLGFGPPSALSGKKALGSFAPFATKPIQSEKAARPFGAPDSDAGEDDQDDEDDEDSESQLHDKVRRASPDRDEDKKRPRLHKIEVDDGEAGEITVLSVRAKMFCLDKQAGWKERGAGMLKINVPHACVEFNGSGSIIPGSFDASVLENGKESADDKNRSNKVARLILRQDQTHRVILNTAILPAMKFQEKASLKSVGILFTALEGSDAKPVSITIRMSAANSKLFLNEINAIQRELRGN